MMLHVRIDETSREINPEIETDKYGQEEGKTTRRNYIKKGRERERESDSDNDRDRDRDSSVLVSLLALVNLVLP